MDICIAAPWFPPTPDVTSTRSAVTYFSDKHNVKAITTNPKTGAIDDEIEVSRFPRDVSSFAIYKEMRKLARECDIIYAIGISRLSAVAGIASYRCNTPLVLRPTGWGIANMSVPIHKKMKRELHKKCSFFNASAVNVHSEVFYDMAANYVAESKLQYIQPGTDVQFFSPNHESSTPSEITEINPDNAIISINTLKKLRGVQYVIDALPLVLNSHPNTHFFIGGDGAYKEHLVWRSKQNNVKENVHFLGTIEDRTHVRDFLLGADVAVVMSSADSQNNFAQEALATGCPLVVSSAGGLIELVGDDQRGRVAEIFPKKSYNRDPPSYLPNEDIQTIADNINFILSRPEETKMIVKKAREFMVKHRSREIEMKNTEELLNRIRNKTHYTDG